MSKAKTKNACRCLLTLAEHHQVNGRWVHAFIGYTQIRFSTPLKKPIRPTPNKPWLKERLYTVKTVSVAPKFCPHCGVLIVDSTQKFNRIEEDSHE